MKKIVIFLLLFSVIAAPSYAINIVDQVICKEDVLRSNKRPILVNRLTGEVKYVYQDNGEWLLLTGQWKDQYQKMYNWQVAHPNTGAVQPILK